MRCKNIFYTFRSYKYYVCGTNKLILLADVTQATDYSLFCAKAQKAYKEKTHQTEFNFKSFYDLKLNSV